MTVATLSVLAALVLWIPASFMSACSTEPECGPFEGIQAASRAFVAFSPIWLLILVTLSWRSRLALAVFVVAALTMAALTLVLRTDLRDALKGLGLSSATGFILYTVPYAVAGIAGLAEWRRTGGSAATN